MSAAGAWFVYLIRTQRGLLYCGITTDVQRRLAEHQGSAKGAKSLRGKGLLQLVWHSEVDNRSCAAKAEANIKKLSKAAKERIVRGEQQAPL
jgi:putative endonuclease